MCCASCLRLVQREGHFWSPYFDHKQHFNPKAVFTTPCIEYAAVYADNNRAEFKGPDGNNYLAECVLQLRQSPTAKNEHGKVVPAFEVHPETTSDKLPHEWKKSERNQLSATHCSYSGGIPDSKLEWFTTYKGTISITGVLVRLKKRKKTKQHG